MDELEEKMPPYDPETEPEPVDPVEAYRRAGQRARQAEETLAEHDNMLAETLFELTMQELEE